MPNILWNDSYVLDGLAHGIKHNFQFHSPTKEFSNSMKLPFEEQDPHRDLWLPTLTPKVVHSDFFCTGFQSFRQIKSS